ncbi:unnamed protein product [Clonostachys byssicola]|uniref:Trichodiene oxygenase n=1 Tax=Clonostachys byssicola TaxID=160290 RepID=A0A9N9U983_9HYPO|nr:unnamed protein product [Clonostachys byssicola]
MYLERPVQRKPPAAAELASHEDLALITAEAELRQLRAQYRITIPTFLQPELQAASCPPGVASTKAKTQFISMEHGIVCLLLYWITVWDQSHIDSLNCSILVYIASVAIYRLYFHPLAKFPGPRLAAVTGLYEAYYDLYLNGQYTFKIAELHNKYGNYSTKRALTLLAIANGRIPGPIIRISPFELHVSDPTFFETLYQQNGVWNKYAWSVDAFASDGATIFTVNHHLHKSRRQPLAPYFSKGKVAHHAPMIRRHVDRLCGRIAEFVSSGATFNLGAAATAFSRDASNDFLFNKNYDSLGREDFDVALLTASSGGGVIWRTTKFIRWFGPVVRSIPPQVMIKLTNDPLMKDFLKFLIVTMDDMKNFMVDAKSSKTNEKNTIIHEIIHSKLPASEKQFPRIFNDAATVAGAAFESTASVLRVILFNLYTDSSMLQRLRAELADASANSAELDLKTLEQLPYLTSVVMEGLRLSPAIATRMARVAPERDLFYENQRIPAGTAVGMTSILVHWDESLYPEPKRFNPDRWIDPSPWKIGDKVFVPFSKGTRDCMGRHLAWAELYIFISTIVEQFDFELPEAKQGDFDCCGDQFAIQVPCGGELLAVATYRKL